MEFSPSQQYFSKVRILPETIKRKEEQDRRLKWAQSRFASNETNIILPTIQYDRTISLKVVIANVPCYYQLEIQRENSIDWREGISQIVKCVGVETPHCENVEMWWIHIVKMWRCGGSTFLVWRSDPPYLYR